MILKAAVVLLALAKAGLSLDGRAVPPASALRPRQPATDDFWGSRTASADPGSLPPWCKGAGSPRPELYREYTSPGDCPVKGDLPPPDMPSCDGGTDEHAFANSREPRHGWYSFAQKNTSFRYLPEIPVYNSWGLGPQGNLDFPAEKDSGGSLALVKPSFQVGSTAAAAVARGASGTFGRFLARRGTHWTHWLSPHECEYISFVPVGRTICGVLTRYSADCDEHGESCQVRHCAVEGPAGTGEVCETELYAKQDGTVDGDFVRVRASCDTRVPEPDGQDEVFLAPGVPIANRAREAILDRGVAESCTIKTLDGSDAEARDNAWAVYLRGKGFAMGKLAPSGEPIAEGMRACGYTVVRLYWKSKVFGHGAFERQTLNGYDWHARVDLVRDDNVDPAECVGRFFRGIGSEKSDVCSG